MWALGHLWVEMLNVGGRLLGADITISSIKYPIIVDEVWSLLWLHG